ncbi:hypothetical protein [Pontibacillus yanchengensis]|uniref:Uncharacterized protein n=1 Tax=Pontibacillus yanchengensis Y32 TaxID=1385514 RepID=A0A0A2T928_9BACI|nr:hypothetical protein [Pontibacillus yanchengensis]KGP72069.1 hypothetical protein N782_14280 [Pontibacillus yanchengensis Y32]
MSFEEQIDTYAEMFNQKKDYIQCHHISRDMLLEGSHRDVAKCLATLSAVMEQAEKEKWTGYEKLFTKLMQQLDQVEEFPFNRSRLIRQMHTFDEHVKQGRDLPAVILYKT